MYPEGIIMSFGTNKYLLRAEKVQMNYVRLGWGVILCIYIVPPQ